MTVTAAVMCDKLGTQTRGHLLGQLAKSETDPMVKVQTLGADARNARRRAYTAQPSIESELIYDI